MGSETVLVVALLDYPSNVLPPVTVIRRLFVITVSIYSATNLGRLCAKSFTTHFLDEGMGLGGVQ